MDGLVIDVDAQLQLCRKQQELNTFEIERLKALIAQMKPDLDSLRASHNDGGKLHVGYDALKKMYYAHLRLAGSCEEPSHCLLLFYAIECGLKYVYLRRNKMNSTKDLAERRLLSIYGHDLARWCKELKTPAFPANTSVQFRLESDKSKTCHIDRAHEVWRYGAVMEAETQVKIIRWLFSVSEWIKTQMGGK